MKFSAPSSSAAHRSLLGAAAQGGFDTNALRRLFWLINAHPDLVAHAQVFLHLLAHLQSDSCQPENLDWAGEWTQDIPAWVSLCGWMFENREALSRLDGMEDFDRQPRHKNDNPNIRHGVSRHGVVAGLWNRHEAAPNYPPADDCDLGAARYFQLQTQVLLSYAESRFRLSQLDFYEGYAGLDEAPIAPAPTSGLGLAIREFSHSRYQTLVQQLPATPSPINYSLELNSTQFRIDEMLPQGMSDAQAMDAIRYLEAIRRYFRRFAQVMTGWKPSQKKRKGHGASGGHGWKSGFVHFQSGCRVFISLRPAKPDDPDLPYQQSDQVWIDLSADESGPVSNEAHEIEQLENLEDLFRLYDPEELGGRLHQRRLQDLAVESQAQQLPFDYSRLTREELCELYLHLETVIGEYLIGSPKNVQIARGRARAALMLKTMLILGQPLERARQLRFSLTSSHQMDQGSFPLVDGPTLLLAQGGHEHGSEHVAGFCMPAISPSYKRVLPDELDDINRHIVDTFVLPDLMGLGRQLHAFLQKQTRPNAYIFGVEPAVAKAAVREILRESGHERLSLDKIRLVLPGIFKEQGCDQTVGWVLTSDQSKENEPRMFYTRHSVANLQRAYCKAARRLGRMIGLKIDAGNLPDPLDSESAPSVGARFVIRLDDLKSLVSGLKEQLKDHRRTPLEGSGIRRYHDAYLLYTWLVQSLQTSVRPTSRPNELYTVWNDTQGIGSPVWASLAEKDTRYSEKARPIRLVPLVEAQFDHYRKHFRALSIRLGLIHRLKAEAQENLPLLVISDDGQPEVLRPIWIEGQLRSRFAPLPANFHRGFLRTELIERGCNPEVVDAFMGHANMGETPYSRYSAFDYQVFWDGIKRILKDIQNELGLEAVPSRLVPYPSRACHT